ncbi:MAG: YiaA/YiaB family inner membrane protein [Methylocystis sp.]|nr:YiaA/YiaB family inner membrane protein [Methylocystis sp.]
MTTQPMRHSQAFVSFCYATFSVSLFMLAAGIFLMPETIAMKGFLAMGVLMLVQSCIVLTKTIRDNQEAEKFHNRIEDARTERLLMDVAKVQ